MNFDDAIKEACDFVHYYTGIYVENFIPEKKSIEQHISSTSKLPGYLHSLLTKLMLVHEVGELAYFIAHEDEIKDYSGFKRLYGEIVGDYFVKFYEKKVAKEQVTKYKITDEAPLFPLRYLFAREYVEMLEKLPEREQILSIQKIIFKKYPNSIKFHIQDKIFSLLEKLHIM